MRLELGVWRVDGQLTRVPAMPFDLESRLEDILDREIHGVKINAVFFKVFKDDEDEYPTRAWSREPESSGRRAGASTSASHSISSPKGDWNGE